jgi:hypothetical protein
MPIHADTLPGPNRIGEERAARLRQAVKLAGGNNRVSSRSGVPLRTLGNYLRGRDIPSEALVAIADACAVSLEWLATGRGTIGALPSSVSPSDLPKDAQLVDLPRQIPNEWRQRGGGADFPPPHPNREARQPPPPLFSIVDMDLLGGAIDSAVEVLKARGAEPRGRRLAQIACLLYDEAKQRIAGSTPPVSEP